VGRLSVSISVTFPLPSLSLSLSLMEYAYFTNANIDDATFGAHFLLYIIGLRGEIARGVSSLSYRVRAATPSSHAEDRETAEDPSILQKGHELRELLQLLLRQTDLVRLTVLLLVDLWFAWLHYGTVNGPASLDGGQSRLVQRHSAHCCHGRQVQGGVRLRYQPHPKSGDSVSAEELLSLNKEIRLECDFNVQIPLE